MGCKKRYSFLKFILVSLSVTFIVSPLLAGQHSVSSEVQENITLLEETGICPGCNLTGANLNRMVLSGVNLQGADLSRATLFLTDLSGANLQNCILREAQFGGADLGDADLRGTDLTGASLAGAYLGGAILDGEMVTTTPYVDGDISDVEETVYVEDIEKVKSVPETADMTIGDRRDFEETPPAVPVQSEIIPEERAVVDAGVASEGEMETHVDEGVEIAVTEQVVLHPDAKKIPVIQDVRIQESEIEPQVLLQDDSKKHLSEVESTSLTTEEPPRTEEVQIVEETERSIQETVDSDPNPFQDNATETVVAEVEEQPAPDDAVVVAQEKEEQGVTGGLEIQSEKVEAASIQHSDGETTVVEADLQVDSDTFPPAPEDADAVASPSEAVEQEVADNSGSRVESQTPTVEGPMIENQVDIQEEYVDQVVEEGNEIATEFSVNGLDSKILQNIERLLDTNQCYGCTLAGADLRGEDLEGADLEDADLKNALLQNADLENANLKGTNLTGANLTGADLSEADCYRAIFTDADLTDATLENTLFDDADLSGVKGYQKNMPLMQTR